MARWGLREIELEGWADEEMSVDGVRKDYWTPMGIFDQLLQPPSNYPKQMASVPREVVVRPLVHPRMAVGVRRDPRVQPNALHDDAIVACLDGQDEEEEGATAFHVVEEHPAVMN